MTINKQAAPCKIEEFKRNFISLMLVFALIDHFLTGTAVIIIIFFNIARIKKYDELNQCTLKIQYTPKNIGCC